MRFFFLMLSIIFSSLGLAQDDLIILTEFKANVTADRVGVSFTLGKGSFCYGAQLERAVDTLNEANFQQIGEIAGVCGSQDFEATYTLWDEKPVANRTVYYRVITGFIPTSFLPVTYNEFGSAAHRLSPNSWIEQTTITLSNEQRRPVSIELYHTTGQFVLRQELGNTNEVVLRRNQLTTGIYIYRIFLDNELVGSGKTIVQ